MQLDHLQVFTTIVETGSFRAAAERLHRAQSAVSYAIRLLEEELKLELFSRAGYRPALTAAGSALHRQAERVLAETREMKELALHLGDGWESELGFAVSALFPLAQVSKVLKRFSEDHRLTRLLLSIEVLGAVDKLRAGTISIALTEFADDDRTGLAVEPIAKVPLVAVAAPSHLLARSPTTPIPTGVLKKEVQIILSSTSASSADKRPGILKGGVTWSTTGYSSKLELLRGGLGWGLMPRHLIEQDLKARTLTQLDIPEYRDFAVTMHLVRRRDERLGPAALKLWQLLEQHCREKTDD